MTQLRPEANLGKQIPKKRRKKFPEEKRLCLQNRNKESRNQDEITNRIISGIKKKILRPTAFQWTTLSFSELSWHQNTHNFDFLAMQMWVESLRLGRSTWGGTATHSYSCLRNPTEEPAGLYSPWVEKQLDTTETLVNSKLWSAQGGTVFHDMKPQFQKPKALLKWL